MSPTQKANRPLDAFLRDLTARFDARAPKGRAAAPARRASPKAQRRGNPEKQVATLADDLLTMNIPQPMRSIEVALLSRAFEITSGNVSAAGKLLGIHRKAVERALVKYKIGRFQKPRPKAKSASSRSRKRGSRK